jgi:hypothetical protein
VAVFFRTAASRGMVQRAYYTQSRSRSILPAVKLTERRKVFIDARKFYCRSLKKKLAVGTRPENEKVTTP